MSGILEQMNPSQRASQRFARKCERSDKNIQRSKADPHATQVNYWTLCQQLRLQQSLSSYSLSSEVLPGICALTSKSPASQNRAASSSFEEKVSA